MTALPLARSSIDLDFTAARAEEVLYRLAELLSEVSGQTVDNIVRALRERESQGSTALGLGVAVPHARMEQLSGIAMAALRAHTPVAFGAPDGLPVRLFVALLVPQSAQSEHLELLSQIASRLGSENSRLALLTASSPEQFFDLLVQDAAIAS